MTRTKVRTTRKKTKDEGKKNEKGEDVDEKTPNLLRSLNLTWKISRTAVPGKKKTAEEGCKGRK